MSLIGLIQGKFFRSLFHLFNLDHNPISFVFWTQWSSNFRRSWCECCLMNIHCTDGIFLTYKTFWINFKSFNLFLVLSNFLITIVFLFTKFLLLLGSSKMRFFTLSNSNSKMITTNNLINIFVLKFTQWKRLVSSYFVAEPKFSLFVLSPNPHHST